jgi:hypothetical protein
MVPTRRQQTVVYDGGNGKGLEEPYNSDYCFGWDLPECGHERPWDTSSSPFMRFRDRMRSQKQSRTPLLMSKAEGHGTVLRFEYASLKSCLNRQTLWSTYLHLGGSSSLSVSGVIKSQIGGSIQCLIDDHPVQFSRRLISGARA